MKFRKLLSVLSSVCAVLAITGCASENVVFITKTSFGIDVSSEPSSVNLGYDRFEGYIGPRFESGAVPAVAASFETNGKLFDRVVKQVYATGEAARVVTSAGLPNSSPQLSGSHKVMMFSTGTTTGLKIGFGASGATDVFTLGYKRREASVIPITNGQFPSVLASLQTDVDASSRAETGFGVHQYFATGEAAVSVAGFRDVKKQFNRRLVALDESRSALNTVSCLAALKDSDLPRVWSHAEQVKLLGSANSTAVLQSKPVAEARDLYITSISIPGSDAVAWLSGLQMHRDFVCALAGRSPSAM